MNPQNKLQREADSHTTLHLRNADEGMSAFGEAGMLKPAGLRVMYKGPGMISSVSAALSGCFRGMGIIPL